MSIASRITSIENHIEEAYTEISRLGVDLTNVDKNIDNIADMLQEAYSQAPKVTGEGSSLSLTPTRKGGLGIIPKGACEQDTAILPAEYQQVEYIESSGTQYIKTGINTDTSKTNFKIKTEIQWNSLATSGLGQYNGANNGSFIGINNSGYYNAMGYTTNKQGSLTDFDKIDATINYTNKNVTAIINGTTYNGQRSSFPTSDEICIFTIKYSNYNTYISNCKMKYFEIYYDNVLAFNFIPCYRKSDSVIGMYDLVNGVFYTNQGTGTFTKGNDTGIPNPDYPQDIRVVTGDNSVVVHSQNLLDMSKKSAGGTPDSEDYLTNSHTGTSSDYFMNIWFNKGGLLKPNTDYLLVIEVAEITETTTITINDNNAQSPFISSGNLQKSLSANNTYVIPVKTKSNIENAYDLRAYFYLSANVSLIYKMRFSIIEDLTITAQTFVYRPFGMQSTTLHLGSNYLAGIGDYKDEIVGKTDGWKIKRYVGKVVLDGSEDESYSLVYATIKDYAIFYINDISHILVSGYCDKLTRVTGAISKQMPEGINYLLTTNYLALSLNKTRLNSVYSINALKEWLNTNNLTIYYLLATPTEETITDTRLIESLNDMYDLMGYNGTTNITISSNSANAQMTAQISALKGE